MYVFEDIMVESNWTEGSLGCLIFRSMPKKKMELLIEKFDFLLSDLLFQHVWAHITYSASACSILYYREIHKSVCVKRAKLSIPVQVINTQSAFCFTSSGSWSHSGSVFRFRPHHPVANTHTSEKSVLNEETNLFWVQKGNKGMCPGDFCHSPSLFHVPRLEMHKHLNIHEGQVKTIFVHWRPVVSRWNGIMKKPISSFVRAMWTM